MWWLVLKLIKVCSMVFRCVWLLLHTYAYFRDMTNDDNVMISDDGQLTLVKASKQHEGEWKCQATNSEGTTEQTMKVLVKMSIVGKNDTYCINCLDVLNLTE